MLNRRLIILFFLFVAAAIILGLRLARLQLVEAAHWQEEMRTFVHRHRVTETYRGEIQDRFGNALARDVPCDELAIDYRAMNRDNRWLTAAARKRLDASGEKFPDRASRAQAIALAKQQINAQLDTIPDTVARVCSLPREDILQRFNDIRARIAALRQDLWSRAYQPNDDQPDPGDLDTDYRDLQLKDELIAHTIVSPLSVDAANYFRQHAAEFPGLVVRDNANRRDYPLGPATAHIIGTLQEVSAAQRRNRLGQIISDPLHDHPFILPNLLTDTDPGNLAGYLPGDHVGESGAERILESRLRGSRGVKLVDLSSMTGESGDGQAAQPNPRDHIDPTPGQTVHLTLDASLQLDLYRALTDPGLNLLKGEDGADHFVAIVVMSLNGEVLAMLSLPTYDPNTLDANRARLNADRYRTPLVSRATSAAYQPGSTIKPLLASAALSEHLITPGTTFTCTGHLFPDRPGIYRCDEVHGPLQLVPAIAESCNVYFYNVGMLMGVNRLANWYGLYGFGQDSGLELPESQGSLINPGRLHLSEDDAKTESIFLGIGQGKITATPLQMASAYATLLRGGLVIPPRIVLDTPPTQRQAFRLDPAILDTIRRGMEGCVASGTAKEIFRGFHLPVAGKTGTAETSRPAFDDDGNPINDTTRPILNPDNSPRLGPDGKPLYRQAVRRDDDAWFIGYAPADHPQYVVAAIMEFGGFGGKRAAPMVKQAFTLLEQHDYLKHMDAP